MIVSRRWGRLCAVGLLLIPFASAATAGAAALGRLPAMDRSGVAAAAGHPVGLGKVLSSADGGQIFGWDIDEHGTDGVLATSQDVEPPGAYKVSVETFDQTTATITRSFARYSGTRHSFKVDGIFAGDVGLVTHYVTPHGTIYANRHYEMMDPVTAERFTGPWTPPIKGFDVLQNAENQSTTTSVVYGIELHQADRPALAVANLAEDSSTMIALDPSTFGDGHAQLAQDPATDQAVLAASTGAVGGPPPINAQVDLSTGHITQWNGLNNGPLGAGFVNGLAVDPRTEIACTTTELNAQVEFYDLADRTGTAVQLPGTVDADQLNSGAAVANDPVHKLFLVADPIFAPTGGSAIVVYDEHGGLVESIPGFSFSNRFAVIPIRVAVVPKLRMGWVDGPGIDQIQQFFY